MGLVAVRARGGMITLELGDELGALLLKELAVTIVVHLWNTILVHDVSVCELCSRVQSKASTIGHTKSLRHFY